MLLCVCCSDSLVVIISALYCKLLVVIGLAFPLSEVIASNIPPFYYEVSEVRKTLTLT